MGNYLKVAKKNVDFDFVHLILKESHVVTLPAMCSMIVWLKRGNKGRAEYGTMGD